MSEQPAVLTERHGDVLVIRLDRPDARNAVNGAVATGIEAAIDELESDDALVCGVLAAIHSDALAGGFEIARACDLLVAAEGARLGLPEVKRSLVALGGGLVEFPRLVGEKLALELALTGDPIPVERLERAGLVSRVVPRDRVMPEALALATRIAANGPLAVRASYRIIRDGRDADTDAYWALSMTIGLPVFASADAREGATAFVEKRPPIWQGR